MSAAEDYTIEFSRPFTITASTTEISINQIGQYYGYVDTNEDPNGILPQITSILVTSVQASPTTSSPFAGNWFYVVDGEGSQRVSTEITEFPFRLSDLSNCALRFVPSTNEDGYAKFTFLFYSSILVQPAFIVEPSPGQVSSNAAYSADYCAIQWNYQHINYAPTINAVNIDLSATSVELIKTVSNGVTVASIIGNSGLGYGEPNSLDSRGIALTGVSYTDADGNSIPSVGIWQFKQAAASTWSDVLFNEAGKSYYFKEQSGYSVRFYPRDNKNVFAQLFFRAWDSSDGGAEGYQSTLGVGVNAPTSANVASVTIPIEKVNYKPILKNTSYSVAGIYEDIPDVSNTGVVLNSAFFADVGGIGLAADTDPRRGIIITGVNDNNNGVWQFYNGSAWVTISKTDLNANPSRALHLAESSVTAIRFRPSQYKNGQASFTYSAWSGLNAVANYGYAALDGSSSYSDESASASIVITPVENPPDFSGNKVNVLVRSYNQGFLPSATEISAAGINVANTILSKFTIADVDSVAADFSVVLTGVTLTSDVSGTSFNLADFSLGFNIAGQIGWGLQSTEVVLSDLTSGKAVYLNRTTNLRLRTPANFVGKADFTFYLWNERNIDGLITQKNRVVNLSYSALTNKEYYSVSTASFRVVYADINDPPVLAGPFTLNINSFMGVQLEDALNPIETPITSIMSRLTITDADSATMVSIPAPGLAFFSSAVSAPDFANAGVSDYGGWFIRRANGTLVALSGLSRQNAYHVRPDSGVTLLYRPAEDIYGLFRISAVVWDRSNEGVDVDAFTYATSQNTSETSPYSANSVELQLTVTGVNDQPVVNPIVTPSISYAPFIQMSNVVVRTPTSSIMGDKLSDLIQQISPYIIDKDPLDNFGIVISSSNTSFQYSIQDINGTPDWKNITENLHLRPTQITRIRYINVNQGLLRTSFTVLVWDMSNGLANGSISSIDNSTRAYSSQSVRINVSVVRA